MNNSIRKKEDTDIFAALIRAAHIESLKEGNEIEMEDDLEDDSEALEPVTGLPYAYREIDKDELAILITIGEK